MNPLKRLFKGGKRLAKRLKLALGLARAYQTKRSGGADERWELIRQELTEQDCG